MGLAWRLVQDVPPYGLAQIYLPRTRHFTPIRSRRSRASPDGLSHGMRPLRPDGLDLLDSMSARRRYWSYHMQNEDESWPAVSPNLPRRGAE